MTVYTNSAGVELEVQRSLNPSENFVLLAQAINHDQLVTIGKPFEPVSYTHLTLPTTPYV